MIDITKGIYNYFSPITGSAHNNLSAPEFPFPTLSLSLFLSRLSSRKRNFFI